MTATRTQLLEAARLGRAVALADLTDSPDQATQAYASWRRLRRRAGRQPRQLLRVAFDTGYGRTMHTDMHTDMHPDMQTDMHTDMHTGRTLPDHAVAGA